MHKTAISNCARFIDAYIAKNLILDNIVITEIGSQNLNGSIRSLFAMHANYIGVDVVDGPGVDIVLSDFYKIPINSDSVDVVLSSSCFEHSEMFWLLFLEIMRILKPDGVFYLNVPSNGDFHRFPVDCWRFYPDSGLALVKWARLNGLNSALLESYISYQDEDQWNDYVAVFIKDEKYVNKYKNRIINLFKDFQNGLLYSNNEVINLVYTTEDRIKNLHNNFGAS
ncbi:class I SAM-dependent methyltransferase [Candidatus Roizmanbacteria bacterium]|nr:class I SAM-dependent methyltransferase [Candidatus Roizmanbacteria bacterium]